MHAYNILQNGNEIEIENMVKEKIVKFCKNKGQFMQIKLNLKSVEEEENSNKKSNKDMGIKVNHSNNDDNLESLRDS